MTPEEKHILAKEKKQTLGFLDSVRTENNTISQELAGMIEKVANLRTAQLGIELAIEEFEKKLK